MKAFLPISCLIVSICSHAFSQEKSAPEVRVIEILQEAKISKEVTEPYAAAVKDLNSKYSAALVRYQEAAQKGGKLEEALSFKNERELMDRGGEVPPSDSAATPQALKKLRITYRASLLKLWDPLESTCRHASLSIL